MGFASAPTCWPSTIAELQDALEIRDPDVYRTCHGYGKKSPECKNPISISNRAAISCLLRKILTSKSLGTCLDELDELSGLILCQRWHQYQAEEWLVKWKGRLGRCETPKKPTAALVKPTAAKMKPLIQVVEVQPSPLPRKTAPRYAGPLITPPSSPELRPLRVETTVVQATSKLARQRDPVPVALITPPATPEREEPVRIAPVQIQRPKIVHRSAYVAPSPCQTPEPTSTKHVFELFAQLSLRTINRKLKDKLLEPLMKSESTPTDGYIYGYSFPSTHAATSPTSTSTSTFVKIGYTNNLAQRMSSWSRKCGYTPKLEFAVRTPHYVKIEKIVHLLLRNEQRRELSCPGCGSGHREWFEVDIGRARMLVRLWAEWANREPIDAQGELKDRWVTRVEAMNVDDVDCWVGLIGGGD